MATSVTFAPLVTLSDGNKLPIFGLGTWQSTNKEEMTNLIRSSFDLGYRHIDTAILYGNEKIIGDALKTIFAEGKYKREDIFIVSKIFPFAETNTLEAIKQSLQDLQIKQLDLLYVHWTFAPPKDGNWTWNHKPVHVQWAELEQVHALGLTKSLGVSNYNVQSLVDLLSYAKVKPVSNQVELHVFLQQPELVRFCNKVGVHVTAYSPLARFDDVINNEVLKKIAAHHKAQVSQVLLAFLLHEGISVIPKTEKVARLKENFEALHLKLTPEDIKALKALDKNLRIVNTADMDFFQKLPIFA